MDTEKSSQEISTSDEPQNINEDSNPFENIDWEQVGPSVLAGCVGLLALSFLDRPEHVFTILLWLVVIAGVLVAIGMGLYASSTEDDEEKGGAWIIAGGAVVIALGAWFFIPEQSDTKESIASKESQNLSPKSTVPSDAELSSKIVGVWKYQLFNDPKSQIIYTFRPDGSFARRFVSDNLLKGFGGMVFGVDYISGRWWITNHILYTEFEKGNDFNPASGVLKGLISSDSVEEINSRSMTIKGFGGSQNPSGVLYRVE